MTMTNVMEIVDYNWQNFNLDINYYRSPRFITDRYLEYPLVLDKTGNLSCSRDPLTGKAIRSPRSLCGICTNVVVKLLQDDYNWLLANQINGDETILNSHDITISKSIDSTTLDRSKNQLNLQNSTTNSKQITYIGTGTVSSNFSNINQKPFFNNNNNNNTNRTTNNSNVDGIKVFNVNKTAQFNLLAVIQKQTNYYHNYLLLPANLYPQLLTEALLNREPRAIEWVVSNWPYDCLKISSLIPVEDTLHDQYLTLPFDESEDVSLVDCLVLGLIKLNAKSRLRCLDLSGFSKDRRLSKEISRLPILWIKPMERILNDLHQVMAQTIEISKEKVQHYLNRIASIYSNVYLDFKRANITDSITILMDLHMNIDEVAIGLSLQDLCSPFKFLCHKLWVRDVSNAYLPMSNLPFVLDTKIITHFEFEGNASSHPNDTMRYSDLLDTLPRLSNLESLSLPDCFVLSNNNGDCNYKPTACPLAEKLSCAFKCMPKLARLNLSYCNLKGCLYVILESLEQNLLSYLNLKDCRLDESDIFYVYNWKLIKHLRELNLSCNNLQYLDQVVLLMLEKMRFLTCFSVSFCSLNLNSQIAIARHTSIHCTSMKIACLQGYTPPPRNVLVALLDIFLGCPNLQKLIIFPETYAFPGNVEHERKLNRIATLDFSYRYLEFAGRMDLMLE